VAAFDPLQTLAPLLGLWCRGAVRVHFHLPKPLHGWRQFVGEVGIIVVGVLIALSAEQLVETMHWHHAVDAARDSLSDEIEEKDYDAAELAIAQPCIDRQLQLLEQAVELWPRDDLWSRTTAVAIGINARQNREWLS